MSLANESNKEGLSFEGIKIALADALANKDWNLASELQISIAIVLCDMAYSGEFLQYEPNALSFVEAVQRRVNCIGQASQVARLWQRMFDLKEIWGAVTRGHIFTVVKLANGMFLSLDGKPERINLGKTSGITYPSVGYRWVVFGSVADCVMGSRVSWIALNHLESGNLRSAEGAFRSAIKLIPEDPDLHFCRGEVLSKLGHFDEAVSEYKVALSLDPREHLYRDALMALDIKE